jgi:hypothetical protein
LAAACGVVALAAPLVLRAVGTAVGQMAGAAARTSGQPAFADAIGVLAWTAGAAAALLLLAGLIAAVRRRLLAGRTAEAATWDCGYAAPSPRMQYTATSFAEPLTELFGAVLHARRRLALPQGLFPRAALLETDTPDRCTEQGYAPLFAAIASGLGALRWLQHGRVQLYVLYVALTLVVLLVWKLG